MITTEIKDGKLILKKFSDSSPSGSYLIRLTDDAAETVKKLSERTGESCTRIASLLILFAAQDVEIEEEII